MNPKEIGKVIAQELIWENRKDKRVSDDSIEKECYFAVADLKADIKEEVIKRLEEEGYTIGDIIMSNERQRKMNRIEEIHDIINDFASKDLYSANCETVKHLYRELHRLEAELDGMEYEEPEEEDYTPQFIGGSDVPINGYYE